MNQTDKEIKQTASSDNLVDIRHFFACPSAPEYADIREDLLAYVDFLDAQESEERMSSIALGGADDWDSLSVTNVLMNFNTRNRQASVTIKEYAKKHIAMDVGIGVVGTLIPGAALPSLIASIAAQYPLIYEPMIRDLARVYKAEPNQVTSNYARAAAVIDGGADIGVELVRELVMEFLQEQGITTLLGASLPFVGGVVAAGLDAVLGASLTWYVGIAVATYYQNGETWCTSPKQTIERAKYIVGGYSAQTDNRADPNKIPDSIPEVRNKHIRAVLTMASMMKESGVMDDVIIQKLREKKFPEPYIQAAMRQLG